MRHVSDITLIKFETRRECFEELHLAQKSISDASFTLGAGHDEVRAEMINAQIALAKAVSALWEIGVAHE